MTDFFESIHDEVDPAEVVADIVQKTEALKAITDQEAFIAAVQEIGLQVRSLTVDVMCHPKPTVEGWIQQLRPIYTTIGVRDTFPNPLQERLEALREDIDGYLNSWSDLAGKTMNLFEDSGIDLSGDSGIWFPKDGDSGIQLGDDSDTPSDSVLM